MPIPPLPIHSIDDPIHAHLEAILDRLMQSCRQASVADGCGAVCRQLRFYRCDPVHVHHQYSAGQDTVVLLYYCNITVLLYYIYMVPSMDRSRRAHVRTPAINEGCTRSLRISHTSRRAPLQPVPKAQVPCTPYHPPNIAGVHGVGLTGREACVCRAGARG